MSAHVDVARLEKCATRFLTREARLLDERRYEEWLGLLTSSFYYSLPLPMVREDPFLPRHHERGVFFEATKVGLELKLGRMHERTAWSDRPHSAVRRFVSNVMIDEIDDSGTALELLVHSNVLVTTVPAGEPATLTTAGRRDRLIRGGDEDFKLARRSVLLDVEVPTDVQLSVVF